MMTVEEGEGQGEQTEFRNSHEKFRADSKREQSKGLSNWPIEDRGAAQLEATTEMKVHFSQSSI
jgi:hypothetical protein